MLIRGLALACLILRNVTNSTSSVGTTQPTWNVTTTWNVTNSSNSGDVPTWSIEDIVHTVLPLLNSTPSFQPSTRPTAAETKNVTVTTIPVTVTTTPIPTNTTVSPNTTISERPTKFYDENNTNPYPGYTLPTTGSVLETVIPEIPEIIQTEIPSETSLAMTPSSVYITLISVILTCLFFFISS